MDIRIPGSPLPRNRAFRLSVLPLFFALLLLVVGSLLLNDGISKSDISQTVKVITGAMLLSLGLISICIAVKNWWKVKRIYKETEG